MTNQMLKNKLIYKSCINKAKYKIILVKFKGSFSGKFTKF